MAEMTNAQRKVANYIDKASASVVAYTAPTIPALENLTPQGLLEELGNLTEARKAIEKIEKIVKERLKSQMTEEQKKDEFRSDNFKMTIKMQDRTALNQTAAKAYFEEAGILEEYMTTTEVETTTVKAL